MNVGTLFTKAAPAFLKGGHRLWREGMDLREGNEGVNRLANALRV